MKTIGSLGLIRGLIAQIIGTALGMGLVMLIRQLEGKPAWEAEPVIVIGALLGAVAFLAGVGVFNDWFKWSRGVETPMHHGPPEDRPAWTRYFSVDYSHKIIGIQYTVTGILLMLFAGTLAMIFRIELAQPGLQFLDPATFARKLQSRDFESLVIWARRDTVFRPELTREFIRTYRASKVLSLPCGHYTVGEFPFKWIDGLSICRFLGNRL